VTRVAISPADPDEPDARDLIAEVAAELTRVTGPLHGDELRAGRCLRSAQRVRDRA
jgi:hypothetical protein